MAFDWQNSAPAKAYERGEIDVYQAKDQLRALEKEHIINGLKAERHGSGGGTTTSTTDSNKLSKYGFKTVASKPSRIAKHNEEMARDKLTNEIQNNENLLEQIESQLASDNTLDSKPKQKADQGLEEDSFLEGDDGLGEGDVDEGLEEEDGLDGQQQQKHDDEPGDRDFEHDGEGHGRDVDGEDHGRDGEDHGRDGEDHGRDGEDHGRDGEDHGRDGEDHGRDGEDHGRDGEDHGRDGEDHGRDGENEELEKLHEEKLDNMEKPTTDVSASGDAFSEDGALVNTTNYERDVTFVERVLQTGENIVKGTGHFDQAAIRSGQINYTQTVTEKGTDTVQRPGFQTGKVETRVQVVPEKFQYGEVEHVFLPKSVPTDLVNPLFNTPTTADGTFSPSGEPVLGETIPDSTTKTTLGGKGYYNYQTDKLSTQASATLSAVEFSDAVTVPIHLDDKVIDASELPAAVQSKIFELFGKPFNVVEEEPIDRVNDFKTTMSQGYRIDYIDTLPADWQKTYTISGTKAFQQPGKISGSVSYTIPSEAEVVGFNLIPGKEVGHIDTYVKLTVGESGSAGPETAVYEGEADPALTEMGPVVPGNEVEGSGGVEFECGSTASAQRDESSETEDFKETSVQTEDLGVVVGETRSLEGTVKPANIVLLREDGTKVALAERRVGFDVAVHLRRAAQIATDVSVGGGGEGQTATFTNEASSPLRAQIFESSVTGTYIALLAQAAGDDAGDPSLVGVSYAPKGLFMLKDLATGQCFAFKSGNVKAPLIQKDCDPNGKLTVWETLAPKHADDPNLLKLKVDDKKLFVDTPGNEDTAKFNKIQAWNASMGPKDQQVRFSYLGENEGNAVVAIHAGDEPDLVYTMGDDGITRALPWQEGVTPGIEIVPVKQVITENKNLLGKLKSITKSYELANEETENEYGGEGDDADAGEMTDGLSTDPTTVVDLSDLLAEIRETVEDGDDGPPAFDGGSGVGIPPVVPPENANANAVERILEAMQNRLESSSPQSDGPPAIDGGSGIAIPPNTNTLEPLLDAIRNQSDYVSASGEEEGAAADDEILEAMEDAAAEEAGWAAAEQALGDASF
eukprot:tig00000555_g2140.t1